MDDATRQRCLKYLYRSYNRDEAFLHLRARPGIRIAPGRGSMSPHLVIVGEAPGRSENRERKPFMGPAGSVLNGLLAGVGLIRRDVFVTNVVKYRPVIGEVTLRNRIPRPSEIADSRRYLLQELELFDDVSPQPLVVLLGGVALWAVQWRVPKPRITDWHGKTWKDEHRSYLAMYHPAVAVYDPTMTDVLRQDFEEVSM